MSRGNPVASLEFIDTNIIFYAFDRAQPAKRGVARRVLADLKVGGSGVLSSQVLLEVANSFTKKLKLSPPDVGSIVLALAGRYRCVQLMPRHIAGALEISWTHQTSIFDALLIDAAESAGCDTLLTEDLNDGQVIRGVRVHNPFKVMPPVP